MQIVTGWASMFSRSRVECVLSPRFNRATCTRVSPIYAGTIPRELGEMSSLEQLHLHSNELTAEKAENLLLIDKMCRTRAFVRTSFFQRYGMSSSNAPWTGSLMLAGPIPEELGKLAALKELDLSLNGLTGERTSWCPEMHRYFRSSRMKPFNACRRAS